MVKTSRVLVHAGPETIWKVLVDSVETPQRYLPDIEASTVMERRGGGAVRELKIPGIESSRGNFDFFIFERGSLKEIKSTEKEGERATGVFGSFQFDNEIVRKVTVRGTTYTETVQVSEQNKEIRRKLVDHPAFSGRITIKAVPCSVQNPMAPVDLQFFLELEARKGVAGSGEEMFAAIKEEQHRLKEKAEQSEMGS